MYVSPIKIIKQKNSECLGRNIMEAKVIVYNIVIKPGRVFSALLALQHGFWAIMAEYMREIAIIIVNLEKVDTVLSLGLLCPGSWAVLRSLGICSQGGVWFGVQLIDPSLSCCVWSLEVVSPMCCSGLAFPVLERLEALMQNQLSPRIAQALP